MLAGWNYLIISIYSLYEMKNDNQEQIGIIFMIK
jgi:hypothetical protein